MVKLCDWCLEAGKQNIATETVGISTANFFVTFEDDLCDKCYKKWKKNNKA